MLKALTAYLVAAMLSWSPAKDHARWETEGETIARYEGIATDEAAVALEEDEEPLYPGETEASRRAETGLQLAGVAFYEGRYWGFVDDGSCNSLAWKLQHRWARDLCDGGHAWSLWQVHASYAKNDGIELVGDTWRYGPAGSRGPALVRDRRLAARVALHMMRGSLRKTGSLCGYTGEQGGDCPKARERREIARRYLREHPFAAPAP